MAQRTPQEQYEQALTSLDEAIERGEIAPEDAKAIKRLCWAFDEEDARESLPKDLYESRRTSHKKHNTLKSWVKRLSEPAKNLTLVETDSDKINGYTTGLVKSDGPPGKAYVRSLEYALSKFYRFHNDLGVNSRDITIHDYNSDSNGWDERDLLDADERAALRTVADHPRDKCIFHLLLYCGLRNTGLRTLRIRDIKLENHEWYFNTTADGLKDIHRPDEPRPLFQAEKAVRDWLDYHPDPQQDNYLITPKPNYNRVDPTSMVTRETIRAAMASLKERTHERNDLVSVRKPCHPHMLRHNFVSMARKHPDISDGQIKFWLGHAEDSNVMETTYSHLSSDDYNEGGKAALGTSSAGTTDDSTPPWDSTCEHCDMVLAPGEDVCNTCGTPRGETPWDDASADIRNAVKEMLEDPDPEDFQAGFDLSKTIDDMVREKIEDEIDTAIQERLEEAGFA